MVLGNAFVLVETRDERHVTPRGATQAFRYYLLRFESERVSCWRQGGSDDGEGYAAPRSHPQVSPFSKSWADWRMQPCSW